MEIEVSWDCHVLGSNKQAGGYPQAWFRAWYHPLPKLRTYLRIRQKKKKKKKKTSGEVDDYYFTVSQK